MTCMEFETLQKIIAEVLDVEEDEITMDTRLLEDLGADSLDAVEIIMGIEDERGITVPQEELESKNLATVGDVYELMIRWRKMKTVHELRGRSLRLCLLIVRRNYG